MICLKHYYSECVDYLKSHGLEVNETAKMEIAARMLLALFTHLPIMIIQIPGIVNGVRYFYSQTISIRDRSINEIMEMFTMAKSQMSIKYGGPCELLMDEIINNLIEL